MSIWMLPPSDAAQIVMMIEDGTISRATGRLLVDFFAARNVVKRLAYHDIFHEDAFRCAVLWFAKAKAALDAAATTKAPTGPEMTLEEFAAYSEQKRQEWNAQFPVTSVTTH